MANLIWKKRHQLESKQFHILPLLLLPVQLNSILIISRDLSVQHLSAGWSYSGSSHNPRRCLALSVILCLRLRQCFIQDCVGVYMLPESRSKSAVTLCDGSVLAFSLVIMENFGPCQALFEVYRHHREQLHLFLQCSCFCFFVFKLRGE